MNTYRSIPQDDQDAEPWLLENPVVCMAMDTRGSLIAAASAAGDISVSVFFLIHHCYTF